MMHRVNNKTMKTMERLILKYLIRVVYGVCVWFPIKKQVVFATNRTHQLNDNFKFIYREMKSQSLDYHYVFLLKEMEKGLKGKVCYFLHLIRATYYLATSEFFIIDDFYFPVYVVKLRQGTEVIQTWHACGAFKKFGYSILDKTYGADNNYVKYIPIHKNYSHVVVSSKEVVPYYAEAFNMSEERIRPIGIPRTDLFFDEQLKEEAKNRVYTMYPMFKDKRIILYAPTFRGATRTTMHSSIPFDLKQVVKSLDEDTLFVLKMHPFVSKQEEWSVFPQVVDATGDVEVNDLLLVADVLISDYSSLVFEYALLERPMIFYAHDRQTYTKERDFYYEYESFVPGPIVETTEALIQQLQAPTADLKRIQQFKARFFNDIDGKASQRFVNQLILKK